MTPEYKNLIVMGFLGKWTGLAADSSGHPPGRFRFGSGNSPSLRRRDMDIKLIFNDLWQTLDWLTKIDGLGRTREKTEVKIVVYRTESITYRSRW